MKKSILFLFCFLCQATNIQIHNKTEGSIDLMVDLYERSRFIKRLYQKDLQPGASWYIDTESYCIKVIRAHGSSGAVKDINGEWLTQKAPKPLEETEQKYLVIPADGCQDFKAAIKYGDPYHLAMTIEK